MTLAWDEASTGKVNEERTATLTFKENNIRAIYIDWDDGESNKVEESNYQWVETTEPKGSFVVKHTYNKSGTFKPVIQTINSYGFVSRFNANESSNSNISPFTNNSGIQNIVVNDNSATAISRLDNVVINSGIDNSIMDVEGPKELFIAIAPTITRTELTGTIQEIQVSVEGIIQRNKLNAATGADQAGLAVGTDVSQETITSTIDFTTGANQYGVYNIFGSAFVSEEGAFSKVIKVKYDSCKATGTTAANAGTDYTTNEVFNRLKIFVVTKANDGNYYPITYVTAGSPIKQVEDYLRYTSLDMSQSRAAASNVTISNYRYDNGKWWFNPVNQWSLSTNILGTGTKVPDSVVPLQYTYLTRPDGLNGVSNQKVFGSGATYKWYNDSNAIREDSIALNDYGNIPDQYHMIRNSVMPSSNSGSIVTTNQPEVFLCHPCPNWTTPEVITQTSVVDYTSKMKNNTSSDSLPLASLNQTAIKSVTDEFVTQKEKEYLLMTFDSKTNKVFINATSYANTLMSDTSGFDADSGLKIAGVEYLHINESGTRKQNAYWKPLKFKDTTRYSREFRDTSADDYDYKHTSLAKSGYISFDMPSDWTATTLPNLCGGIYNTASGSFAACVAAGNDDVPFTATAVTNNAASSNGYGDSVTLTLPPAAETAVGTIGSVDDVGRFKYICIVSGNAQASGSSFWVASGASNGWNGTDKLTLMVGTTGTAASNGNYKIPINGDVADLRFSLRRINIYDVVNGASKSYNDDNVIGDYRVAELIAAGGQHYNAGTSFFKNLYNCTDAIFTGSSWATNPKFLLKVTLSGATGDGTAGTPCPTLWNVFDANQGQGVILKEVDDSAYNLNSLQITSDLSIGRQGQYFKAISRKGQTFVIKTGVGMTEIGFTSVALGDENSSSAFDDHGPSTLYGHLHKLRNIQADGVDVYWDEPQKDGTFVRLWGKVTNVNETRAVGGPRAVKSYTFTLVVQKIALIKNTGILMTDIYPLGGIQNERDYS
tara:strand:+ start:5498 stop:8488 length:2991 start_codon:yes stop_codon:yes gene_type:complete